MFDKITEYCRHLEAEFDQIPGQRQTELQQLRKYIKGKIEQSEVPQVIVICTHNSRRSHLGQLWLAIGADYYGLPQIGTFSGGTEATAFNPRMVAAIKRAGLEVNNETNDSSNPHYQIKWNEGMDSYVAFSKKYGDLPNPTKLFAAVMVCSEADEGCPVVLGADFRLSLPYDDPKAFDDTALETAKYDERCRQIGREMLYVLKGLSA